MSNNSGKRKVPKSKRTTTPMESKASSEKEESVNPYFMWEAYRSALKKFQARRKSKEIKMTNTMGKNAPSIEEQLAELNREYPLIPHTGAGCLFSTVRRMKAEKEMGIPINRRSGFAISVETGKGANEMTEQEWEDFYKALCEQLNRDYPELYQRIS